MNYQAIITIEPGKRGGKPCIRGLRITVYDILDYFASGMTEDEVLRDFPDLTREDIRACLAFAADRERRLTATGTMGSFSSTRISHSCSALPRRSFGSNLATARRATSRWFSERDTETCRHS